MSLIDRVKGAFSALVGIQANSVNRADPTVQPFNRVDDRSLAFTSVRNLFFNYNHQIESRKRARFETQINGYAIGICKSKATDLIGVGPRMILRTGNAKWDKLLSAEWVKWARASRFANALRVGAHAKTFDGGVFLFKQSNPKVKSAVKLHVKPILQDMVRPYLDQRAVDGWQNGIKYDEFGNEEAYSVFDRVGDTESVRPQIIPADRMIHWWNQFSPQQTRPFSEMAPSGEMWGALRRYGASVVAASEMAARLQAVMKTTLNNITQDVSDHSWEEFRIPDNGVMALPVGFDITQFKAEQPVTAFPDAKREFLQEATRAHGVPYNVASGDSSSYNYSSSRADVQIYWRPIDVERTDIEDVILSTIADDFLREACLVFGIDFSLRPSWVIEWGWDGPVHQDPLKETNADIERIRYGLSTFADVLSYDNRDVTDVHTKAATELGLTVQEYREKLVKQFFDRATSAETSEYQADTQAESAVANAKQARTKATAKADA